MAIGEIRLREGISTRQYTTPQVNPNAFGAGVSRALSNVAGAFEDAAAVQASMAETLKARNEKHDRFLAEEAYQRWVGEENRAQAERLRASDPTGRGITNQSEAALVKAKDNFISRLPDHLKEEYRGRLENFVQQQITSTFNFEFQQGNAFFKDQTQKSINIAAADILSGDSSYDEAAEYIGTLIGNSDLPEAEKLALTDQAEIFLAQASFQKEMELARSLGGTVRGPDEGDVVAAGLLPHERGILNAIAARESDGKYNVRYGGDAGPQTFDDYSKHPALYAQRPDGRWSSAAGKYQFTYSTWKVVAAELGLKDFSPESQDRAAIHLARQIYNRQIGAGEMTFDQVLRSGNRDQIIAMKRALTDENGGWEAFRHMSDDEFANIVMGTKGISGGGTGGAELPDIWTDSRFDVLPFEDKFRLAALGAKQADDILKAQAAASKAALSQQKDDMFLATAQGEYSLEDEQKLIQQGLIETVEDLNTFRRTVKGFQDQTLEADRVASVLENGGVLTLDDDKGLNQVLGKAGIAAVQNMDEQYMSQIALPIFRQAGYVPSDIAKVLDAAMQSNNPVARKFATDYLGEMFFSDRNSLERSSGLSKQTQRDVVLATTLRPWFTQEQVDAKLMELRDPKLGAQVATMRTDAGKLFDEEFSDRQLLSQFETIMPFDKPEVPLSSSQTAVFRQDMRDLFVEGYLVSNDQDAAMEYAKQMAGTRWAPSEIGGEHRMMRDGPERFYPRINGDHSWIDQQIREEFNFDDTVDFQLVPDGQTLYEGAVYQQSEDKTGVNNASYQIVVKTPEGLVDVLRDPAGQPIRYAAEITGEMRANTQRAISYERVQKEIEALTENVMGYGIPRTPEQKERLQELEKQKSELEGEAADPTRIVPEKSVAQLESELEIAKKQAEIEQQYLDRNLGAMFGTRAIQEVERLEKLIADRKRANASR